MTLALGTYLHHNRYQITDRLGQGGMGAVYLATDQNFPDVMVAIKENTMAAIPYQRQFEYEAGLLRQLNHPNLARVTNYFIEPSGRQYLVMDYIAGNDLMQKLFSEKQPQEENDVLRWMDNVLDAIAYMHAWRNPHTGQTQPILHRDIKPSNIKRTQNDDIFLVDFGLAKSEQAPNTMTGARGVTPGFSPIEQYDGGTTTRSDIYALGATMYMLLTNNRLPTAVEIAGGKQLIAPRSLNPAISRHAERVTLKALQLQAADRYGSVDEMRSELNSNNNRLGRLSDLRPASKFKTSKRTTQRRTRRTRSAQQPVFLRTIISTLLIAIVSLFGYIMLNRSLLHDTSIERPPENIVAAGTDLATTQDLPTARNTNEPNLVVNKADTDTVAVVATVALKSTSQLTRSLSISTASPSLFNNNSGDDNVVGVADSGANTQEVDREFTETIKSQGNGLSTAGDKQPLLLSTKEPKPENIPTNRSTATPLPTDTPTRRPMDTVTPTIVPTNRSTATATKTEIPTLTAIPPTRRPTTTPTPSPTSTRAPTKTPIPPTLTPTATTIPPTYTTTSTPTHTPTRSIPQVTIVISSLNIRSGPGSDYAIVGAAIQKEKFVITGHAFGCTWYEIQHPRLTTAWLSGGSQYVSSNLENCVQIPSALIPPTPTLPTPTRVSPTATFTPYPPTATFTPPLPQATPVPPRISTPASNNGSLPNDKGCYQLQNQLGVNLTITITNPENGQTVTSFVVPINGEIQSCLNPGQYNVTISGPMGWAAFNTAINVSAGNHVIFPLSLNN